MSLIMVSHMIQTSAAKIAYKTIIGMVLDQIMYSMSTAFYMVHMLAQVLGSLGKK